ncbi:TetR/AcrR family transcriptional regulator [Microbacterium sp.]|uniref:TetR/AcrR family transcriptional regulator n=1 Tax=Microbacterium sp. TaxID=51671 RepID=UPI003D6EB607
MRQESTGRGAARVRLASGERRAQIIAVASAIIAQRGFWGLTLRDVATDCGITEAGVLHHVGSKDGLLIAVLEHRDRADRRALADRLGVSDRDLDRDPAPFGLRALCAATVEHNAEQAEIVQLYAVLLGEALATSHPAHEYFVRREAAAMSLFMRAAATDGIAAGEREHIARDTMAAMDGLQLRWLAARDRIDFVAEWRRFAVRLFD